MYVVVGSTSELKLRAVRKVFTERRLNNGRLLTCGKDTDPFTIVGVDVPSGVSDQPHNDVEMFQGAANRASAALQREPSAYLGIGIENGLIECAGRHFDVPAVVVLCRHNPALIGSALGAGVLIPHLWVVEVNTKNTELGKIVQQRAGGGEKDPFKFLSDGLVDREQVITDAVALALAPFVKPEEYRNYNPAAR